MPNLIPLTTLILCLNIASMLQAADDYEEAPILYSTIEPTDAIAQLRTQIAAGTFEFDRSGGEKTFLRSILKTLNIPESSQVLVFSKTSKQNDHITPQRPRALYYSDAFYVGWVQGGDVEIISIDPNLGPIFYILRMPRTANAKTQIIRDNDCLRCHAGLTRNRTPGLLIRSVFTDHKGFPILTAGTHFTEHTSPISERWGGWYVTGDHGDMRHMGNSIALENEDGTATLNREPGANLQSLTDLIDTTPYIRNESDIVSLMILEHQVTAHNAIISASYTSRQAIHRNQILATFLEQEPDGLTETTRSVLDHKADELLKILLFTNEFQLEGFGIEGNPEFQTDFLTTAKRTKKGKSLKDLQLLSHLFKNRCSYMIYGTTFTNLPKQFKDIVLNKLHHILTADLPPEDFQHLSQAERTRIHHILAETLPGFPPEPQ